MFKVGDRVRCIEGFSENEHPRKNEIYTVVKLDRTDVWTYIKHPEEDRYINCYSDRFELVTESEKEVESAKTATGMTVTPILHTNYTLVIKDQKINLTKSELYDLMEVVKGELNEG